jgi:hypothetical protein
MRRFGQAAWVNFVTRHVDGRGTATLHTYDNQRNRIHTQHRIPSIVEDFKYNVFGQLTAHVLPDNGSNPAVATNTHTTTVARSAVTGIRTSLTGSLNLTTSYDYDAVGNIIRKTDARGHDTQYAQPTQPARSHHFS